MRDQSLRRIPLAYFITFRTYGTWHHGDRRGSMDRRDFNEVDGPQIPYRPNLEIAEQAQQKHKATRLSAPMRRTVRDAISEVCRFREYVLHASNVRTTHVHVVVGAIILPEKVMTEMKAYATRRLRESSLVDSTTKIWARHGSTRFLWKPAHISGAVDYVLYGQGDDLPNFGFTDGV